MGSKRRPGLGWWMKADDVERWARAEKAAVHMLAGKRCFWVEQRETVGPGILRLLAPRRVTVEARTAAVMQHTGLAVLATDGTAIEMSRMWLAMQPTTCFREMPVGICRRGLLGRLTAAKRDRMARQEEAVAGLLRAGDGGRWLRLVGGDTRLCVAARRWLLLDKDEGICVLARGPEDVDGRWVALGDVEAVGVEE